MSSRRVLPVVAVVLVLWPAEAQAWAQHYLLTDAALRHPDATWAAEDVEAETLETFLEAESANVRAVIPLDAPTAVAFLRAARLNPTATFPLVYRRVPGGPPLGDPVDQRDVSPWRMATAPLRADLERVPAGAPMTARQVLSTFSDEPDWGFDHNLWGYSEYGYGEVPFGSPEGESSKAAMHMHFEHESALVQLAAPELLTSFMEDRVELFSQLARCAFRTGHPYWAWRFTAWAAHYVEDYAQPYHARALPSATFGWTIGYLFSKDPGALKRDATRLAANRHYLYEDFVAYGLQRHADALAAGASPSADEALLAGFLSSGDSVYTDTEVRTLLRRVGAISSPHALRLDTTLGAAFGARRTSDPAYDIETDPTYTIAVAQAEIEPAAGRRLLADTGSDFANAGRAVRTLIAIIRAP
ncbi:MAG: hypothetical protein EXR71_08670 [Myxococcales bacterium]|nr:hypothetical protein [Myxococcales bacterium]